MFTYCISGLAVRSHVELPGVAPVPVESGSEQVLVRQAPVPARLSKPHLSTPVWEIDDRSFLLRLPGIGRFLATDGSVLEMEPDPGTDPADGLPFLLGTAFGALLLQRGNLVLHASSVAYRGRAFAFTGPSGTGKSTLAAALCAKGCCFVSDDISVADVDNRGAPMISPDGRNLRLFESSIDHLNLVDSRDREVRSGIGKFYVAPPGESSQRPVPLAAIYRLRDQQLLSVHGIRALTRVDAAQALLEDTYRPRLGLAFARKSRQVQVTAAILQHAQVFELTRRRDLADLERCADALITHWDSFADHWDSLPPGRPCRLSTAHPA